jgi:hypothetical protein
MLRTVLHILVGELQGMGEARETVDQEKFWGSVCKQIMCSKGLKG